MTQMTPLDHLKWAGDLPACGGAVDRPVLLQVASDQVAMLDGAVLSSRLLEAKAFWSERKQLLDSE